MRCAPFRSILAHQDLGPTTSYGLGPGIHRFDCKLSCGHSRGLDVNPNAFGYYVVPTAAPCGECPLVSKAQEHAFEDGRAVSPLRSVS